MLVLIATDELLGDSTPNDHHAAVDGELVTPVVVECTDERCDMCQRAWLGLVSHGATTTAMVVDRPGVTEAVLRERLHRLLDCCGVIDAVVQASEAGDYEVAGQIVDDPVAAVAELIDAHVDELAAICDEYPIGTMLSRMGQLVAPRAWPEAA